MVQLLEYQGEEVKVGDLVSDLISTGFLRAYVEELIWDLFIKKQGVVLCGEPLGTEVMMPDSFHPPEELVAAHQRAVEEATRRVAKVLPTFFELATASG